MSKRFWDWLILLRPHQWVKNSLIFAGYIFAGNFKLPILQAISDFAFTLAAFLSFCFLSGSVYAINDVVDKEKDRRHPIKRNRPVASGRVSVSEAIALAVTSALLGLVMAIDVAWRNRTPLFLLSAFSYLFWGIVYSFWLKRFIIVDALGVAAGFVLRVVAGCLAIKVAISPWLILCTLLLSLFIAFSKRRHELLLMGNNANSVRSVLGEYSPQLLDTFISVTASMTIMAYSLYTFTAPHILLGDRREPWLMVTIPFVVYGVLRYLYLAYQTDTAGAPEQMLRDKPFVINLILWTLTVISLGLLAR
ncbi:MAG: decaprenyl-phosphate phosphoribosyltransferase [Armatimonadetes bacterium]|nr:decaprenyl-phosphate phosphoribosyltransferase [Armatimonadota bacterium]MDW8026812.1 decaprenyl-phosphate phosphoribosyltransferase [Armatimonadota bacterium]